MKTEAEIEEALERAVQMQCDAEQNGSRYTAMKYEDGLREALDWVIGNADDDPTK